MKLDFLNFLKRPAPLLVATRELVDAQLAKLEAETAQEYARAICDYNAARIKRLKSYIATLTEEEQK